MKNITMPIIKRLCPDTLAHDILSVQSMTAETGHALKVLTTPGPAPKEGDVMHSLLEGWMRFYGDEWIHESAWIKIKQGGL